MPRRDSYAYILTQLERLRRMAEAAELARAKAPYYAALGSSSEAGPVGGTPVPDARTVQLATAGEPPDERAWQRYLEALERRLRRLADDFAPGPRDKRRKDQSAR